MDEGLVDGSADTSPVASRVAEARRIADRQSRSFRHWDLALSILSILGGTVATVLSGGAALGGSAVANTLGGWEYTCLAVAIGTLISTLAGGVQRQMQVSDKYARWAAYRQELMGLQDDLAYTTRGAAEERFRKIQKLYIDLR